MQAPAGSTRAPREIYCLAQYQRARERQSGGCRIGLTPTALESSKYIKIVYTNKYDTDQKLVFPGRPAIHLKTDLRLTKDLIVNLV